MTATENALHQWTLQQIHQHAKIHSELITLTPMSGDAGFRQYFRVNTQPSLLAVMAPKTPGNSDSAAYFAGLSRLLRDQGIPTPQIVACDIEQNFLLIEDFGEQSFLVQLNQETVDLLYGEALMVLSRLQQIPRSKVAVPDYSRRLLQQEMALFQEWFVEGLLQYTLSDQEQHLLAKTFRYLEEQAMAQPQKLVHRDFHSRNLQYREGEAPGVIDFQDAVWGPVTYDLVSLLRDCYIRWSPEQVRRWLMTYGNMAMQLGIIPAISERRWQLWFDTMGLQRHIKVLGIFARLALRDGKKQYLQDLPLVLRYTLEIAEEHLDTQPFAAWIKTTLLPLIEQQDWYSNYATAGDAQ